MTAPAPDQPGTGIAGTDTDPYKDQTIDTWVLLFAWWPAFALFISQFTGFIPFHNYRQWHIFQNALKAGWNEGVIKKGIVPAIPDCPILWQDVIHYWNFGGFTGTVAYEMAANIRFILALVLMLLAQQTTHMSTGQIAVVLLQQIGITV
jgi:hypothetical protein